jgi:polar amino acid transport system ATP-binding protein
LSGGQKQRVSIARALAMDPKIMLLDEPTSALDPELIGEVLSVIRDLARGGMTMVLATHQIGFTRTLADEVLFMENGSIIERGLPEELLSPNAGTRSRDFCSRLDELYAENE